MRRIVVWDLDGVDKMIIEGWLSKKDEESTTVLFGRLSVLKAKTLVAKAQLLRV